MPQRSPVGELAFAFAERTLAQIYDNLSPDQSQMQMQIQMLSRRSERQTLVGDAGDISLSFAIRIWKWEMLLE